MTEREQRNRRLAKLRQIRRESNGPNIALQLMENMFGGQRAVKPKRKVKK